MKSLFVLFGCLVQVGIAYGGTAPPPDPKHSAQCVAALKVRATALEDQLRAGQQEAEPQLQVVLERGFAFIGSAYLQGVSKAEANELLAEASAALQSQPPVDLVERQAACDAEGRRLLEEAGPLAQGLATKAARKRIEKLKQRG
jgi:hypothetical protein